MRKFIVGMILLGLLEIALSCALISWRATFWDAISQRNLVSFSHQLEIFTGIALLFCFVSSTAQYLSTKCAIVWREILTLRASQCTDVGIENYSQRVQEDCREYPILVLSLSWGLLKAAVYVIVFSIVLCYKFSTVWLLILIAYSVASTLIARAIAKPLVTLQYDSQRTEASYRHELKHNIFQHCLHLMRCIAKRVKLLGYFQTFYAQLGVVVPLIIIAPAFFAGNFSFGTLMQARGVMDDILNNLSFGITSFNDFTRLLSCRKRLNEMGIISQGKQ